LVEALTVSGTVFSQSFTETPLPAFSLLQSTTTMSTSEGFFLFFPIFPVCSLAYSCILWITDFTAARVASRMGLVSGGTSAASANSNSATANSASSCYTHYG
jgi:hypothetical protein